MPLVYQGRLRKKPLGSPTAAMAFGEETFEPFTSTRRLDLRLAWERPEAMQECEEHLSAQPDAYWMDIAVHADIDTLPKVAEWASRLRCGHVSLFSLKEEHQTEVRLTLPGVGPERYDDERYEARFGYDPKTIVIKSACIPSPGGMTKAEKTYSAQRMRGAHRSLMRYVNGDAPEYEDWLRAHAPTHASGHTAWGQEELTHTPVFFGLGDEPDRTQWADIDARATWVEECPADLTVALPETRRDLAVGLWTHLAGWLPQIDVIVIRCIDERARLLKILDQVDLFHYHPQRNNHLFGVSTWHTQIPLGLDTARALLTEPALKSQLADWDLRWSNLDFDLEDVSKQDLGQPESQYIVRSDSNRTTDRLYLVVPLEDPNDPAFRSARSQLAARLGDNVSRESAWEFVGSPTHTPLGRKYAKLNEGLALALRSVMETPQQVTISKTPFWLEYVPLLRGRGDAQARFVERMSEQINQALPGFRFDPKARITDKYFIEFVRRVPGGYQIIEVSRFYEPSAFSVRFAACLYRVPFSDLDTRVGFAVPGCLIESESLYPEGESRWTYRSPRALEHQLAQFGTLLDARARPFFAESEKVLKRFDQSQQETP